MKNFSKLSKNIISELSVDITTVLELKTAEIQQNKTVEKEFIIYEDIEKNIDEIISLIMESKSSGHKGRNRRSVEVGTSSSNVSVGTSIRRSVQSFTHGIGGGRGETFGRISNNRPDSRLENQNIHPSAMTKFQAFWSELKENGYEPFVTSGQRMPSHQRDLYDSGTGSQTAQPCRSDHQYGYALDINVNLPPRDGETESSGSARMASSNDTWAPIVAIAHKHGLDWQGRKDRVHFYVRGMVTGEMKSDCKDFFGDINIRSRGVAAAMKAKEEENPAEINRILKIT
jgi:hypothetical protein